LAAHDSARLTRSVVVDGPPLLEEGGLLELPRSWVHRFDNCVIVCTKNETRLRDLVRAEERLRAMGLSPLGTVWWRRDPPARRGPVGALRRAVLSRVRRRPRAVEAST
jgi:hypothetical protein